MSEHVEICRVREPQPGRASESGCSVYACGNEAALILEVGGGSDERHTHVQQMRVCWHHGHVLYVAFKEVSK